MHTLSQLHNILYHSSNYRVHHKYVTLLKRRLEWMFERGMFPEAMSASEIIHKVFSALHSLADISKMIQVVTDSVVKRESP